MIKFICTNRNPSYKIEVENILKSNEKQILDFFERKEKVELNFQVYIYNTIEELISGLQERGFPKDPDYMCACQKDEDKSLNFFEPKDNPSEKEWSKEEYKKVIFHEEIHIIQYCIYGKQPEWLTEGIAKIIDGTYSKGIKWLLENYIHNREIPLMKELKTEFGCHEYDSYDYAYLMVSYLIDTMGKTKFLKEIADQQKIESISENLISKAIAYYNQKYFDISDN